MISTLHTTRVAIHAAAALLLGVSTQTASAETAPSPPLPQHLRDTGLYVPGSSTQVDPQNLEFSPQYPLWSDGAHKRRWIRLPQGTSIDASRPDAWEFPPGTRLWKEFSHAHAVETRFIERQATGAWRFGSYVWNEDGTDAMLAPSDGATIERNDAPQGRYTIPAEADCRACHEGAAVPVLGFSGLQLSPDRDPLAPHAERQAELDLHVLVERGLIKNLPASLIDSPPRIAARSPLERAALGYLHANCGHCHNDSGAPVPVDLTLAQSASASSRDVERALRSMLSANTRFRGHGLASDAPLIAPGEPTRSVLVARLRSRNPQTQMPPLGTQVPDAEAVALIERWIDEQSHTPWETEQ